MYFNLDVANMDFDTTSAIVDSLFNYDDFKSFKKSLSGNQLELVEGFEKSLNSPLNTEEEVEVTTTSFKIFMMFCMRNEQLIPDTSVDELKMVLNQNTLYLKDYYKAFSNWFQVVLNYRIN